jgi:mono/diheme cytochrome c family protein
LPLLSLLLPAAGLLTAAAPSPVRSKSPVKPAKVAAPAPAKPAADTFPHEVAPLVRKYCGGCHGASNPAAGVSLVTYKNTASVLKERSTWQKVAQNVGMGVMPPKGLPQPTKAEKEQIVAWIESTLSKADCQIDDPGRVTMRRLNRTEYNNTIRDLFFVLDLKPAEEFPLDDVGYGFDNIGDVLSISPLLMEKYLTAAEKVVKAVIVTPESASPSVRYEAEQLPSGGELYEPDGMLTALLKMAGWTPAQQRFKETDRGRRLVTGESLELTHVFPRDGDYRLRVRAFGDNGRDPASLVFRLDGREIETAAVLATQTAPDVYQVQVKLPAGEHRFTVGSQSGGSRKLVVDYLEVQGPMELPALLPISHRRIIPLRIADFGFRIGDGAVGNPQSAIRNPQSADEAARKILAAFARRAYRRPVTVEEVNRLVRYVDLARQQGDSFERGIQLAVQATLVSPHFLFRVEADKTPNDKKKRLVGQYEMASRLSYYLWSSMPDEELFSLAAQGKLNDPKVLTAQAKRMLKDSRARSLAENFAGQWLGLRKLAGHRMDRELFPEYNNELREAMITETEKFFETIVKEDHSILEFLDSRFTYLNERLAKHYGIDGVKGDEFRRVMLTSDQRGGLLRQASFLTVTSNPNRTSLVQRGKWVLEEILGTPPPPPPPDVPPLEGRRRRLTGTLRQRLEQHRKNPNCFPCHARMDPIGFALENYDAIGRWRTKEGEFTVDSSGEFPGGQKFKGPAELIAILKTRKQEFTRTLTEKMLTYALGRGLEPHDNCNVNEVAGAIARDGYRFSALVNQVVQSEPFRMRRGDGGQKS